MDDWAQRRAAAIIIHVGKVEGGGEALVPPKKELFTTVPFFLWGNVQFSIFNFNIFAVYSFFLAMFLPRLAFVFLTSIFQRRGTPYAFCFATPFAPNYFHFLQHYS